MGSRASSAGVGGRGVNIVNVSHGLELLNPRRHKLYKRLKYRSPEQV